MERRRRKLRMDEDYDGEGGAGEREGSANAQREVVRDAERGMQTAANEEGEVIDEVVEIAEERRKGGGKIGGLDATRPVRQGEEGGSDRR